jgi:hypothetical protein
MRVETVAEQLFFTTVRIASSAGDGRGSTGTGFLLQTPLVTGGTAVWLVTNRHVVEGMDDVTAYFIASDDSPAEARPRLGHLLPIKIPSGGGGFRLHPDPSIDIAVAEMPMLGPLDPLVFYVALTPDLALTVDAEQDFDAVADITFIGYPSGLFDAANGLPIFRRGVTASPLQIDYEGKPMFLVDASVFPGSSGSPVFILDRNYTDRSGALVMGQRIAWVGVIAAVYERNVDVLELPTATGHYVPDAIDLGLVYKARTVLETLDQVLAASGRTRSGSGAAGPQYPPVEAPGGNEPAD